MAKIDEIYKDLVHTIINEGEMESGNVRPKYADGTPAYTKYIHGVNFKIKPEDGLPILQSKKVAMKSFKAEIDWIWRLMSNDVKVLNELGSKVWDEWQLVDGTIGPAYGAQLAKESRWIEDPTIILPSYPPQKGYKKANQVEFIIDQIKNNPRSRRIMTNLYDVDDLDGMALEPCVFMTNWQVRENNQLDLIVTQRSADVALGLPSNLFEYSLLHHRIAQVTGREVGTLHWNIFNAHIYDRHIDLLIEQVDADISHLEDTKAKFILPESLDYFGTSLKDVKVVDYVHNGSYKYEIAI